MDTVIKKIGNEIIKNQKVKKAINNIGENIIENPKVKNILDKVIKNETIRGLISEPQKKSNIPLRIFWVRICIITFITLIFSILVFYTISKMKSKFVDRGLYGIDINKCSREKFNDLELRKNMTKIPESIGLIPASFFIIIGCFFSFLFFNKDSRYLQNYENIWNSALLSVTLMFFLGFADDVLELRWRYKLILPFFFVMPIANQYFNIFNNGEIKLFNCNYLILSKHLVYIYLLSLGVFCTNAINIYAGVNGLEVGQSIICVFGLSLWSFFRTNSYEQRTVIMAIAIPFVCFSFVLFFFNKYPAKVFIGDTYTYFAGIVFCSIAIISGNIFSCFIFFIPQLINFLLSIPQLFGFVKCPRHRLPIYNEKTNLLTGDRNNWNLLNMTLLAVGPKTEKDIVTILLILQASLSIIGSSMWISVEHALV